MEEKIANTHCKYILFIANAQSQCKKNKKSLQANAPRQRDDNANTTRQLNF